MQFIKISRVYSLRRNLSRLYTNKVLKNNEGIFEADVCRRSKNKDFLPRFADSEERNDYFGLLRKNLKEKIKRESQHDYSKPLIPSDIRNRFQKYWDNDSPCSISSSKYPEKYQMSNVRSKWISSVEFLDKVIKQSWNNKE